MKTIFAAILFACLTGSAIAQVSPNLLQNKLNSYKLQLLKVDSLYSPMPLVKLNTNFLNTPQNTALNDVFTAFYTNQVV